MPEKNQIEEFEALPYRMELFFDPEGAVWVVRYPELPGCTAHGDSPESAMALGKEAKALWIETALEERQKIPIPSGDPTYSGKLVLRLSKTLHEAAVRAAEREGVSLNQCLVTAIAFWVGADNLFERITHRLETTIVQTKVFCITPFSGESNAWFLPANTAAIIPTPVMKQMTIGGARG
jgi:antitoxin HicB